MLSADAIALRLLLSDGEWHSQAECCAHRIDLGPALHALGRAGERPTRIETRRERDATGAITIWRRAPDLAPATIGSVVARAMTAWRPPRTRHRAAPTKRCRVCGLDLPRESFRMYWRADGAWAWPACRGCEPRYERERRGAALERAGAPPGWLALATAPAIAKMCGLYRETVIGLAEAGKIPSVSFRGRYRFEPVVVAPLIAALREPRKSKLCSACRRDLPLDQFRKVTHRSGRAGSASDCGECHRSRLASLRQRECERTGRAYRTREEYEEELAAVRAAREASRAARVAARAARPKLTREEVVERAAARQRERYSTDPEYRARIIAKKIRRKRALEGATIERVDIFKVAARDAWRCSICGGKVSEKTWSLDHLVPLSAGGDHSYRNVALAHRRCNSRRGAGRLPSQAPLFARLGVDHAT